ncbi:MAG: translocation/assembly module TamB [Acidobacteriia bacterium]|nr:translocation/assembly module TamB [Terriglobia bacterium]
MLKRFRKAVYAFVGLVLLLSVAYGILSSAWFSRFLERRVIASLENFTGGRVEIGEFRFRPIDLHLLLRHVVIHGTEPAGAPPLFSARIMVAQLSPALLLRHQLRLRRLDWNQAEIHIRTQPDGSTNLPGPIARLETHEAFAALVDLSIGTLTLSQTNFFWNDELLPLNVNARELAVLLRSTRGGHYLGSLTSSNLTVQSPHLASPHITLATRFDLSRGDLTVNWLEWQTEGLKGTGTCDLHWVPKLEAPFSFQADADLATLARHLKVPGLQSGRLHAEGHGIYRANDWSAQGQIQARDVTLRTRAVNASRVKASLDYAVNRERADFSNLMVAVWQGTVRGGGEILFAGPALQFRFRTELRDFDLATLLREATSPGTPLASLRPASRVSGRAETTWTGNLEDFQSKFQLQFAPPRGALPGSLPVSGDVRGTAREAEALILDVEQADLQTPKSSLSVRGEIGLGTTGNASSSQLSVKAQTSDLGEWQPLFQAFSSSAQPIPLALKSTASFSGEVMDTIQNPQIRGTVNVGEFKYHNSTWDKFAASVSVGPDGAEVSGGRLEHGKSALDVEASARMTHWRLPAESPVHAGVQAQRTPLAGLEAALQVDYPLNGLLSGRLDIDGTFANVTGQGALRVDSGQLAGEPFDSLTSQIRLEKNQFLFERIQFAKGEGRIIGQASVSPETRALNIQLHGTSLSLADFHHLRLPSPDSHHPLSLRGHVQFDFRGEGPVDGLTFQSNFQAQDVSVGETPLGNFQGQAEGAGQKIHIQGEGKDPAGTFQWSGQGQMANGWPFEVEGQYSDLHVDPWIRSLVNKKFQASLVAGGSFRLSGPLREPGQWELSGKAQTLQISFPGIVWTNEQPIDIHYAQGVLATSPFRIRGPSTDLTVDGSIRLAGGADISFNARGSANATILALVDPTLKAGGSFDVELHATGSAAQPSLQGAITVHDLSLAYADMPLRLSGLNGSVQLSGERATFESLRGVSGGGEVTLTGFLTLAASPHFNVHARMTQVRARYPANFTSILSGDLRLFGTSERGQLEGDIVVRQMFAAENANWLARMIESGGPFAQAAPSAASPLGSRIRLNVRVTSSPPVRLESHDLRLVADIDLRLQGTLASPVELGTIHFLSGEAVLRGNRYKLTRGDITFNNPFRTQALLDLEAQTRVERYELTLVVSGPLDRLKFAYRSDPPLATEDILSLLGLGFSPQQEALAPQGGRTTATVGASALLSEALSSQVTGRITRLFGVSRIKVDPNVGTLGYGTGVRVTVEQQVTHDFTMTYVTNTAVSQYRIIQFEWAIDDNLSLMGIRDQNGIFGLELRFRHRFK